MNGGLSQPINLLGRLFAGTTVVIEDGEVKEKSTLSHFATSNMVSNYVHNKLHPMWSALLDYRAGETKYTKIKTREGLLPTKEFLLNEFVPFWNSLYIQEAKDIIKKEGITDQEWLAMGFLLVAGFLGGGSWDVSDRIREQKEKKEKKQKVEEEKQRAREKKEREREEKRQKREKEKERRKKEREQAEEERRNRPKPTPARTLIGQIKAARTQDELDSLVPADENRVTVLRARDARRNQLKRD